MRRFRAEVMVFGYNGEQKRSYLHEDTIEENVQNVGFFFRTLMNMVGVVEDDTLYEQSATIYFNAEDGDRRTCIHFAKEEDIRFGDVIWEFANALTFTNSQSVDISEMAFSDEEI